MAKTQGSIPSILPLPAPLLEHHRPVVSRLFEQWLAQNRVTPVLLLTGLAGIGKRQISYFIAQWLLCEANPLTGSSSEEEGTVDLFGGDSSAAIPSSSADAPCGKCTACTRAIHGNWIDFQEISTDLDDGESSNSLKIEQFRNLKASAGFGAFDGKYRITLIRDAERMTPQAANSLLKILEEPPPGWVIILTASDASLLLPTLLSRCQTVRLRPFLRPELERLLESSAVPAERRAMCAAVAQGSWQRALALADEETWERRKSILNFLEQPQAELGPLVEWGSQDSARFHLLIDQLEQLTTSLIEWSLDPTRKPGNDLPDAARALATHAQAAVKRLGSAERARAFWTARALRLFRARQESQAPLNRKILLQDILIPWLEL